MRTLINDFCKGQCNFMRCKDLAFLLSNLVKTCIYCIWPYRILFFCYSLVYFAELSTTVTRINLQMLGQEVLCLGLDL